LSSIINAAAEKTQKKTDAKESSDEEMDPVKAEFLKKIGLESS